MELQAATAAPAAPALSPAPVSSMEMQQAASLKLEGISQRGTAAAARLPLGRGRLLPHLALVPHHRLPPLLQLARDQNRLEIPVNESTKAKAFQFSYRE